MDVRIPCITVKDERAFGALGFWHGCPRCYPDGSTIHAVYHISMAAVRAKDTRRLKRFVTR